MFVVTLTKLAHRLGVVTAIIVPMCYLQQFVEVIGRLPSLLADANYWMYMFACVRCY